MKAKTTVIHIRVSDWERRRYVEAAAKAGLTLSAWIRQRLMAKVGPA